MSPNDMLAIAAETAHRYSQPHIVAQVCALLANATYSQTGYQIPARAADRARRAAAMCVGRGAVPSAVVADGRLILDGEDCTPTSPAGRTWLLVVEGARSAVGRTCARCGRPITAPAWAARRLGAKMGDYLHTYCAPGLGFATWEEP